MLEDSHVGVRAAQSAGMQVIMVPDLVEPAPWIIENGIRVERSLDALVGSEFDWT